LVGEAAGERQRFRLGSDSSERRRKAGEQAAVEAPLGPRGGVG
jgi:hypothetical protein